MKIQSETTTKLIATFANGVTVSRDNMDEVMVTLQTQIKNTEVSISCLENQYQEELNKLSALRVDEIELKTAMEAR